MLSYVASTSEREIPIHTILSAAIVLLWFIFTRNILLFFMLFGKDHFGAHMSVDEKAFFVVLSSLKIKSIANLLCVFNHSRDHHNTQNLT